MNNIVLNRFFEQRRDIPPNALAPKAEPIVIPPDPAVSASELREFLNQTVVPNTVVVPETQNDEARFPNIYNFVDWYSQNQSKFSAEQQTALNTLIQMRQLIENGCACKRAGREYAADDYYKTFWLNNVKTDMMSALLAALNVKKVFLSDCVVYPV